MILLAIAANAQIKIELTPTGFPVINIAKPQKPIEKLMANAKAWPILFNRNNEYGHDIYDVTENSLSIDAYRENAFYYRNRGEEYQHRIRYTIKVEFGDDIYSLTFLVKEIYYGNSLTKLSVADFFAPDGRLKEDYEEVKPSLEYSANSIVNSFAQYLTRD